MGIKSGMRHSQVVKAPADRVYRILADVAQWPYTFGPTVHAESISREGPVEHIRLWAKANGDIRNWTSRRVLDGDQLTISFAQQTPTWPLERMTGLWEVSAIDDTECEVTLSHGFVCATEEAAEAVRTAVDNNSTAELSALAVAAEDPLREESTISFGDEAFVDAPAEDVFHFLWNAEKWPERLTHVAHIDVLDQGDVQHLVMGTLGNDGSEHVTASCRVSPEPGLRIIYNQSTTPPIMRAHIGEWTITEMPGNCCQVASRHTVQLNPAETEKHGGLDAAARLVTSALSCNSGKTLYAAKRFCELGRAVSA